MWRVLVAVAVLACAGCGGGMTPSSSSRTPAPSSKPQLPEALEAELAAIRADPRGAIGFGEKAFTPFEPKDAHFLMTYRDPKVTQRLVDEMDGADRVLRLALLHVIGKRPDDTVDRALLAALDDPELTATAAYLLGRAGFKGYPSRPRDDVDAIRAALKRHLTDDGEFEDPFYRRSFRTQDFVLAAYIRLTGPERFRGADDTVGYTLPRFDDAARADLLAQAERMP